MLGMPWTPGPIWVSATRPSMIPARPDACQDRARIVGQGEGGKGLPSPVLPVTIPWTGLAPPATLGDRAGEVLVALSAEAIPWR